MTVAAAGHGTLRSVLALWLLLALRGIAADDDTEEGGNGEDDSADGAGGDDNWGSEDDRGPSSVYIMEHGFVSVDAVEWLPRGTLLLSGSPGRGGFEARLSDAKEFVQVKPELQQRMGDAAGKSSYYAIRMYSPEKPKRVLQASIPANLLADHFEDWHDILEVTVGAGGIPVGLSYRVRHTLGLALFDHTQVHLAEPSRLDGPRVKPRAEDSVGGGPGGGAGGAGGEKETPGPQSIMRKYWWVIIIVMLLISNVNSPEEGSGGKAAGGGGGGGRARGN